MQEMVGDDLSGEINNCKQWMWCGAYLSMVSSGLPFLRYLNAFVK